MNTAGLVVGLLSIAAVTADGGDKPISSKAVTPTVAAPAVTAAAPISADQLPLLFVVDGVRYAGDQVPLLSPELVASVKVIKGHRALQQYGPEASYGVVVITTKLASAHRS
jgi:hypothetical protein